MEKDLFEGKLRCFGHYKCHQCDKFWKSGNSWTDKGQRCNQCKKILFAYYQVTVLKIIKQKTNCTTIKKIFLDLIDINSLQSIKKSEYCLF